MDNSGLEYMMSKLGVKSSDIKKKEVMEQFIPTPTPLSVKVVVLMGLVNLKHNIDIAKLGELIEPLSLDVAECYLLTMLN